MSRMLVRMLLVHNDKPQLWKLAAKWEMEESNSPETARGFLLRGLRFHPDSRVLYTEVSIYFSSFVVINKKFGSLSLISY